MSVLFKTQDKILIRLLWENIHKINGSKDWEILECQIRLTDSNSNNNNNGILNQHTNKRLSIKLMGAVYVV